MPLTYIAVALAVTEPPWAVELTATGASAITLRTNTRPANFAGSAATKSRKSRISRASRSASVGRFSERDGRVYEGFEDLLERTASFLRPMMLREPPALGSRQPADLLSLLPEGGRAALTQAGIDVVYQPEINDVALAQTVPSTGADVLVAGSAIFNDGESVAVAMQRLRAALKH